MENEGGEQQWSWMWETREDIAPTTDLNGFGLGNQEGIYGDEQHHGCKASQDRGAQLSPEENNGQDNLQGA